MRTTFQTALKVGALTVAGVLAAGCANMQAIEDAQAAAERAARDAAAAQTAAAEAQRTANEARQLASGAQSTANQALSAANAAQACCDATNEKVDRMFRDRMSK